jgi:hypothetical protein
MKRETESSESITIRWLGVMGPVIAVLLLWFVWHDQDKKIASAASTNSPPPLAVATNSSLTTVIPSTANPAPNLKATNRLPAPTFPRFQLHPFKVIKSSGTFEWTAEDGKDTNVIRQLAHNELEYRRMVNENGAIYRRQLVYHPEGFTLQAQRAVQAGRGIQQLTLPGLDGQELPVTVTKTDFESGGDKGIFYGKLAGDPDSMVTLAFINGWESFTVISRQNQVFLHAEAREPGELVVKKIDPNTYGAGVCGTP